MQKHTRFKTICFIDLKVSFLRGFILPVCGALWGDLKNNWFFLGIFCMFYFLFVRLFLLLDLYMKIVKRVISICLIGKCLKRKDRIVYFAHVFVYRNYHRIVDTN